MNKHLNPVFAEILNGIAQQPAQLVRAAAKASPRRFTGEPITDHGDLDADAPDERLELEADMARDMRERSR